MDEIHVIPLKGHPMRTYVFRVVVEPDDDRWHAYCPALLQQGGATWGYSKEEALKHIDEVVHMVVQSLIEHGEPVPEGPVEDVQTSLESKVAVIV